jgi:pPIWI RE three-gene island domain Z
MRNTKEWRIRLIKEGLDENLCDVELGLYLLNSLVPNAPANSLWVLLTGYPFSIPEFKKWNKSQHKMYASARHLLTGYRRPYVWSEALEDYRSLPADQRGYEVSESLKEFQINSNITTANFRFDVYAKTLKSPIPLLKRRELKWAEADQKYKCQVNGIIETITIPSYLVKSPPTGHDLTGKSQREPISITWKELEDTAVWMDKQIRKRGLKPQWKNWINNVKLQVFGDNDCLVSVQSLTINRMMHLVGMVSSGKSNLMKVLAVWSARKGLHVTLIVGDVLQIFELAKTFTDVGITDVAPILGNSNRKSHINRLHQAVYNSHPEEPFNQVHPGFKWLSNTCLLSALVKPEMSKPFQIGEQPCLSLQLIKKPEATDTDSDEPEDNQSDSPLKKAACPAYSVCSYHQKERDLVKASIWIATPGSLIYSRIPQQINQESLLYAELIWKRSDLVIIDEVDQYQAYLDKAFSPEQTLRRPTRDAWLDEVLQNVEAELVRQNSQPLSKKIVSDWWDACQQAKQVTDKIYWMLGGDYPELSQWQNSKKYFTDWLLLREVAIDLAGNENADNLMKDVFEPYINNLDHDKNSLFTLTHKGSGKAEALRKWVKENGTIPLEAEKIQEIAVKLEFALLVCVLQGKLHFMMSRWKQVQDILKLEAEDSMWFQAPPADYNSLIPAMPMGNQLAFQYHKSYKEQLGSLRFFRCTGVGRWLLLHFNDLFASDNIASPHILLMSGTSWAGKSPAYHVDIPVTGVLSPNTNKEVSIYSEFLPLYDDQNKPIFVSGTGDKKQKNLEKIVTKLVEEEYLEQKLTDLKGRKILLVVNSYEQVKIVHDHLIRLKWGNRVIALTKDDNKSEWLDDDSENESYDTLQRGRVSEFAHKPNKVILIAPLKAIERGHNIVDENGMAAIGAAYFLVLPHPSPDDLSYAIHSINRWAIENYKTATGKNLDDLGANFRDTAYRQWLRLLHLPVRLRTLDEKNLTAMHWDITVSLWQVVGRLIRGGSNAELFWCDAKFGLNVAQMNEQEDTPSTSILVGIRDLLQPYFEDSEEQINKIDKQIVQALYRPFYEAIANTKNLF